jgi:hypothetical protein
LYDSFSYFFPNLFKEIKIMMEEKDGSSNSTFKGNSGFFFFFSLKRGTDLGHQIGKTTLVLATL